MPDQVPADIVSARYERLVELVNAIAWEENQKLEGVEVEVMVAQGEGKKYLQTHLLSGRARDNRLVHFAPGDLDPRPGDIVTTKVTYAAPFHLVADGAPIRLERTRAGDAWQDSCGTPGGSQGPVVLGMPTLVHNATK